MQVYDVNGIVVVEAYFVNDPDKPFIPKDRYRETEVDKYKRSVDSLITSCGDRYEIVFNKSVVLKETRSIKRIGSNERYTYLVTEKALESLKKQYIHVSDF